MTAKQLLDISITAAKKEIEGIEEKILTEARAGKTETILDYMSDAARAHLKEAGFHLFTTRVDGVTKTNISWEKENPFKLKS